MKEGLIREGGKVVREWEGGISKKKNLRKLELYTYFFPKNVLLTPIKQQNTGK